MADTKFGPSGEVVYKRTYARTLPDGSKENWPYTVNRVVQGNLALAYGDHATWDEPVREEANALIEMMLDFKILPAGRHLWASGVKGRQFLMNCWTSGWTDRLSDHFEFTFMRLMEGGGVGANYSSRFLTPYGAPRRALKVHIVCDPEHADYQKMADDGLLSTEYTHEWAGSFDVDDSREGWASALVDLLDTYMTDEEVKHADRVYDVSRVRKEGARLKTFGGTASGPAPFAQMLVNIAETMNNSEYEHGKHEGSHLTPIEAMEIDHYIAECVVSGGVRRSARMAIVRWDDPCVEEFIKAKQNSGLHWTTNISVEVDDAYMAALAGKGGRMPNGRPASVIAKRVHKAVINGMLTNGEPGFWNSSLSNHGEVIPVYATNPCGEITLQMFEACNLGHVNLDAFAPKTSGESWDEGALVKAHQLMTRFLIRATYADITDDKSRIIQDSNRRIGVGHLGVQGFVVKNGWTYSKVASDYKAPGFHEMRGLLDRMYSVVRNTARSYAFMLRIPEPVKVTTVAPTGSVAKLPGATEGIHPIYARYFEQRIRFSTVDPDQMRQIEDARAQGFVIEDAVNESNTVIVVYPTKNLLVAEVEALGYDAAIVEQADEISVEDMLAFQAMYQKHYADNAVSFTVNVPAEEHQNAALMADPYATPPDPTPERLASIMAIVERYLPVVKGTTVMLDGSRPQAPFTRLSREEYEALEQVRVGDAIDLDCATGACPIR